MISYPHVEDYLEVIAGKKSLPGVVPVQTFWTAYAPIINLARYDNSFLDNVTDQTMNGGALTDKQAELAVKLINKYRRQLNAQNIQVVDMSTPVFRRGLRIIDRSKCAGIDNDHVYLKFPYDAKTIDVIRAMAKQSQGYMLFDREQKIWKLAITEFNVNWVYEYAKQHEFSIDQKLSDCMQKILECEAHGYDILLVKDQDTFSVTNAHASLKDYVEQVVGGFDQSNIKRLIDYASVLGYQVSKEILDQVEQEVGGSALLLMNNKNYDFNQGENLEQRVIDYAVHVNRFPIVVFNPTPNHNDQEWTKHFDPSEVQIVANQKDFEIQDGVKLVYTHKSIKNCKRIPLLVSYVGMMIGTEKMQMAVFAEKMFFTSKKLK